MGFTLNLMNSLPLKLLRSVERGDADSCRALLARGVDANGTYGVVASLLHLAVGNGYASTCLALLEYGGDPLSKNHSGLSALDMAMHRRDKECVNIIKSWIAAGAARAALREISEATSMTSIGPKGPSLY